MTKTIFMVNGTICAISSVLMLIFGHPDKIIWITVATTFAAGLSFVMAFLGKD